MKKMINNKKRNGFTMVELVVVMVILAILALVVLGFSKSAQQSARETRIESDFKTFTYAAQQMFLENPDLMGEAAEDSKYTQYLDAEFAIATGTSAKEDPWQQGYLVSYSKETKNTDTNESYVYVSSKGKNAKGGAAKTGDADDYFLVVRLQDGEVTYRTYGIKNGKDRITGGDYEAITGAGVNTSWN